MPKTDSKKFIHTDYELLKKRVGEKMLGYRLQKQAKHYANIIHQDYSITRFNGIIPIDVIAEKFLKISGLYRWGNNNFKKIKITENRIEFEKLPSAFHGYKILHMSDLHLDLDHTLEPVISEKIKDLDYDLAVITGDFRNSTTKDFSQAIEQTAKIVSELKSPVLGILGNHDFIEMVDLLENRGLTVLLNEVEKIQINTEEIYIAGIDDPTFYRTHDIERVYQLMPSNSFSILLSHSPQTYGAAADYQFDLLLAGHTHAGQVCLPGGIPLVRNGNCPTNMIKGAWKYNNLNGYTSSGTGACGIAVRYFCPPEITVHTLLQKN